MWTCQPISIHALRVEGDYYEVLCKLAAFLFLSTPSGWRATSCGPCNSATVLHFYPRPPGGGRPDTPNSTTQSLKFLSTPSGWRATAALRRPYTGALISIHALRVEGDRENLLTPKAQIRFLSTPSGWRATKELQDWVNAEIISIHALRVEGDSKNGQNFRLFLRKREKNLPL